MIEVFSKHTLACCIYVVTNDEYVWMSLKVISNLILLENPNLEWLLPGHPGEVKWYEWHLRTDGDFCDLGQHADLSKKTILINRRCYIFWNYDMDSRSFPSSLICAFWRIQDNSIVYISAPCWGLYLHLHRYEVHHLYKRGGLLNPVTGGMASGICHTKYMTNTPLTCPHISDYMKYCISM